MKKLLPIQLTIGLICISLLSVYGQDSLKKVLPEKSPVVPVTNKAAGTANGKAPHVNKLVQNVRNAYYRDKTYAEVATIIYANKASYDKTLDRIYTDYDAKKGIPRSVFDADIARKYGDPFHSAKAVAVVPPPVKAAPIAADTSKAALAKPVEVASDKTLAGQYQYLLTKVYNYQQPLIGAFHKSIMDTLGQTRRALKAAQANVAIQTKTIDSLQTGIKANSESLSQSNARVNSVDLLGMEVPKSTYNLIMWGLVVVFAAIAIIVVARSGANTREAAYRTQLYNELDEEFKNYKAKANEKEKKLARDLQTERNKVDELMGR